MAKPAPSMGIGGDSGTSGASARGGVGASDTEDLQRIAREVVAPTYAPFPFVVERGSGTELWCAGGVRYLDFTSGIGVNALGHAHPEVVRAIRAQAERFVHTSNLFLHGPHVEMCRRLCELTFGERTYLANSGSEAMEAALKLARRVFHRRGRPRGRIVATTGGFHGRTFGALSATGQTSYHEGFGPLLAGVTHVPFGDPGAVAAALDEDTAALVVEPIQGNGGVRVPPAGYLAALREACDATGALLILDEIQTGLGRTGRWLACEHDGVTPDIVACAKALGGGLPLGAMITTAELASAFTVGSHGTTFGGNPVACAAGLATLDVIEREGLLAHATCEGERLMAELSRRRAAWPGVREIRGRGLMVGIELDADAKSARDACRDAGLLVTSTAGTVLRLLPPLNVRPREIDEALEILDRVLTRRTASR